MDKRGVITIANMVKTVLPKELLSFFIFRLARQYDKPKLERFAIDYFRQFGVIVDSQRNTTEKGE